MTHTRNIKAWVCIVCMATSLAAPAPRPTLTLDIIDMAAISRMTPQQLEHLAEGLAAEEIMRTKRSSAQQALTSVVSKASSGIQSKHEEKYDFLGLKKSIFYTLFQAVKAITGGVTILKGQLIKGGGHLAATLGKVISVKGDAVSNLGKKIVSSAALSEKKPHEFAAPTGYSAPTAPAHYAHSAPTGFAAHKYPSQLDGRGKLNGVHAGVVILTPLGEPSTSEAHQPGYTPLEPPPSILNSVYSAIKGVFSAATHDHHSLPSYQEPPPPQPAPPFKPMSWGAVDSYGEPAMVESYPEYDPRNTANSNIPYDYVTAKKSVIPSIYKHEGLTPAKIQKINHNLDKLAAYMNENQRSSEVGPNFNKDYVKMFHKGQVPFLPTPVISDNEIGVLPAESLPDNDSLTSSTTTSTSKPNNTTESENTRRKKDLKFILRGNRIVQV
ncbi:unnamed protein product [Leptidea sinapis]|uniref:DUF4774 domain-containing protein n=1 Tax=Leptidea sinapis TaxID=189913 RepID=A0A5E4QLC1_9NEOP|nr:unnamed protein product [Leptidea sinapis]